MKSFTFFVLGAAGVLIALRALSIHKQLRGLGVDSNVTGAAPNEPIGAAPVLGADGFRVGTATILPATSGDPSGRF